MKDIVNSTNKGEIKLIPTQTIYDKEYWHKYLKWTFQNL